MQSEDPLCSLPVSTGTGQQSAAKLKQLYAQTRVGQVGGNSNSPVLCMPASIPCMGFMKV